MRDLFGRNFLRQSSSLEEKLNDKNYPLEDFLKDDEAISCIKLMGRNTKKYFDSERIKQLIKFIIEEPQEEDQLRGHKFPYIACEILKCDCPFISKRFVLNEQEYDELYNENNSEDDKEIDFDFYKNDFDNIYSKIEEKFKKKKEKRIEYNNKNEEKNKEESNTDDNGGKNNDKKKTENDTKKELDDKKNVITNDEHTNNNNENEKKDNINPVQEEKSTEKSVDTNKNNTVNDNNNNKTNENKIYIHKKDNKNENNKKENISDNNDKEINNDKNNKKENINIDVNNKNINIKNENEIKNDNNEKQSSEEEKNEENKSKEEISNEKDKNEITKEKEETINEKENKNVENLEKKEENKNDNKNIIKENKADDKKEKTDDKKEEDKKNDTKNDTKDEKDIKKDEVKNKEKNEVKEEQKNTEIKEEKEEKKVKEEENNEKEEKEGKEQTEQTEQKEEKQEKQEKQENQEKEQIEQKEKKENQEKEQKEQKEKEEKQEAEQKEEKEEKEDKEDKEEKEINMEKEDISDNFISSINDSDEEEKEQEKEENDEEEKIDEEKNKQIIYDELLNHLFEFLDNESSFKNNVLSGYFTKIINFLLKRNTKLILEYFVKNNEFLLNKLLNRIGQASICNIVENILNSLSEKIILDSDEHYYYIIEYIIKQISKNDSNEETVELICQLLINSIIYNNKKKFALFIESPLIETIKDQIKKLYENKENNETKIKNVIELVTKMNNNILINLENRITPNLNFDAVKVEIINIIKINDRNNYQYYNINDSKTTPEIVFNAYKSHLQKYCMSLNEICLTIINDIITNNTNNKDNKKFGLNNIYKFEFLCSVIDLYVNNLQYDVDIRVFTNEKINDLIKTNIFPEIINYFFKYKNNNFYVNIFTQIIQIITNEKSPKELIYNILLIDEKNEGKNLINMIVNDIINNLKYIFEESKNEMYSLCFSHDVSILNTIYNSTNEYIKEIIEKNPKEKFFYEMFIDNVMKLFNKKLYKINDKIEQKKPDLFNPYFDAQKEQSDTDIPFTLQSLNEIISLYLHVYEKYNKNEDYQELLKENEELLEVSIYLFFLI